MQCAFLQQYLFFFFKVAIMLVLREEDHTLWYRPPRIILFSVVFVQERSSDKGLAGFHFKRIFLTVKSQTGQEGYRKRVLIREALWRPS